MQDYIDAVLEHKAQEERDTRKTIPEWISLKSHGGWASLDGIYDEPSLWEEEEDDELG